MSLTRFAPAALAVSLTTFVGVPTLNLHAAAERPASRAASGRPVKGSVRSIYTKLTRPANSPARQQMLDAAPDSPAHILDGAVGVNQAEAVWLRVGDGLIPLRHALEEGAVVFLEAVALDVEREMRLARKPT